MRYQNEEASKFVFIYVTVQRIKLLSSLPTEAHAISPIYNRWIDLFSEKYSYCWHLSGKNTLSLDNKNHVFLGFRCFFTSSSWFCGTKSTQFGPDWLRLAKIGWDWARLVQIRPDCIRLVQIGPDWFRFQKKSSFCRHYRQKPTLYLSSSANTNAKHHPANLI